MSLCLEYKATVFATLAIIVSFLVRPTSVMSTSVGTESMFDDQEHKGIFAGGDIRRLVQIPGPQFEQGSDF